MMTDQLQHQIRELAIQIQDLKQQVLEGGWQNTTALPRRPADTERLLERSRINPHQPIAWPEWPPGLWPKVIAALQKVTRRLLRWYIDPLVKEQNDFNAAAVQSLERLHEEIVSLRRQIASLARQPARASAETDQSFALSLRPSLQRRLRLAFFTPLSPLKTAIADHSEGLLPHMADLADVDLYIDDGYEPSNPKILERFDIHNYRTFPIRDYDAVLYAMGDNASFHTYIYDTLQRVPGVVILHDTTLHRFTMDRTLHQLDTEGYLDEIEYAHGLRDPSIPEQVLAGHGDMFIHRCPLIERVVDLAQGVIVHNEYARQQVLQRRACADVVRISQHFFLPPGFPTSADPGALRAQMGLTGRFVIGTFGILVPDKRLDSCLRAFARFARHHPQATYLFAGNYVDYDLPGRVEELGLQDQVVITGWLDPIRFTELMFVVDVGVHLRYPHIGGTPFSPVRLMGLGVPTIVSDIKPLAEFPEGCCIKIPPNAYEEDSLLACFELLASDPAFRQDLGQNGRRFLTTYHDAGAIARQYLAFIEQTVTAQGDR